jgi:hypothetical protein
MDRLALLGIAATSGALLMTELALTRIFSVTMFYHFAFLAISIALFGLSASGVCVYVARRRLASWDTRALLCSGALVHAAATVSALAVLVRIQVGLSYTEENLHMRLLDRVRPELVPWGWGMNGAFSVIGATAAIFIAMNWGFSTTLLAGALIYLLAASVLAARSPVR